MKITIAGAGAMGSRFGLMLHQAGHEVLLVDGWKMWMPFKRRTKGKL